MAGVTHGAMVAGAGITFMVMIHIALGHIITITTVLITIMATHTTM